LIPVNSHPRGVLLFGRISKREKGEEDPPERKPPKLINFGGYFSGAIL